MVPLSEPARPFPSALSVHIPNRPREADAMAKGARIGIHTDAARGAPLEEGASLPEQRSPALSSAQRLDAPRRSWPGPTRPCPSDGGERPPPRRRRGCEPPRLRQWRSPRGARRPSAPSSHRSRNARARATSPWCARPAGPRRPRSAAAALRRGRRAAVPSRCRACPARGGTGRRSSRPPVIVVRRPGHQRRHRGQEVSA